MTSSLKCLEKNGEQTERAATRKDKMWCRRISFSHGGAKKPPDTSTQSAILRRVSDVIVLGFQTAYRAKQKKKGWLTVQQVSSITSAEVNYTHTRLQCTQYNKTQKNAFGFESNFLLIHLINTSDLADLTLGGVCEPRQARRQVCV